MKKRINILMSISIVCAAASTSAIAAMCSISNNSTKKYNEAKSRLLNLIKKLDNEGQKKANDFIARQDKKFNSTAFKNHSNTSKLIDEIEIFSKKILENLQKDEKQRLEELNKLNKLRLDLQNLINSNDGQNVDSSDAKKALNENQIDDSLPIDKIKKTNENLENAKKELLNKINAERELQSKIFNEKKQELKRVLDLEDTKEVDFTKEQKVFIETNINETSSIEDIKNKIIEVEKATSSLTSKILNTKQQELQEFENIKKDLQDFINTKLNDAKYQSIKQKALDKINSLNGINKNSTIKEIKAGQNALIKAKEEAGLEKEKLDGQNIKDTLKETINNAKEFKKLLIDNDQKIVDLKSNLDNEISKAEQSLSKDKESMESANDLLNTKLIEYKEILNKFNQEKEAKFNELEQTRKNIENFLTDEVKNNPNYATLVKDLTNAKDAKKSVTNSSNKSDIIAANEALIQALADANKAKDQVDEANKSIKEQLNALIDKANTLLPQLNDNDSEIVKAKESLNAEITNANKAVNQNDNASMQSAKSSLDDKVTKIQNQLTEFNKDKDAKFKELEQTRKDIDNFLTDDVKNNPNYATLVKDLTNAKDDKKSVTKSSNKSEIIAANDELKQALDKAKVAKDQIDEANKSIKEQLSDSITNANQLLNKLVDSDKDIQKAKTELSQEIQSASQELNLNNPTSMQSAKESLDAKVTEITKKLETFNKDKDVKFKELEKTRKDIDEFINTNKTNPNYSTLISELTSKRDSKNSVTNSSNKSDIETANTELKQALAKANTDKAQADNLARSTKEQLNKSISSANTLLAKLTDKDNTIQQAKTELEKEVQKANQAVASNNTASMQSAKSSLDAKVTEITKKLETFNKDKDAKFKELEQTRKDIDEFIKQIENDPQTKKNYQNIVKNLKDKKAEKNSITFSNNKKEIQDANKSLQDELNNAKITKKGITDFYNSKKQLEDLIKTDDAKKVGTTEADTILDHYKNISDASKNEEIKQATQKINDIKKIIETKIQEKKRNEFSQFEQIKNELQSFINKDLKDQKYNSIRTKIENKINGVSSINKNSKIQDIENAKKQLEPAKNEFEKIINNIKKFNSQKQKVEEKLKFLDTKDIGTSGSLSNKNKDIKAIFQGFINEIEKELINKNADDKAKDECINKIIFLDKALISRYEGILNVAYKFFGDTSTQNNQTEKNEFFDNLRNNLVDQKVFDQLEKMNMNHFEDFYNTFYNKGNAPLKPDGNPNYNDPKYLEEINKQNELEGPAVKWSAFDDILDAAFVRTAQTSFENKCKNLFNDHKKDDERYGTINKTLNVYDIDIYSKTGRADANDLDLRNKDKIFKGHEYVTFKFSTENVPGRWQKNFKGLAKWDGSKNRYRFVGIVSINLKYEYNLIISTKGENYKKPLSLEYKLGSNNKGQNYNPIIIDKISGIN
ncbi:hypothetical protein [Metamycoplasma hominis]|uniref:hypothetical protein n=2 Tax=Metamycoplasma hominis TaxID=2098 RepID=UPI003CF39DC2